jgi:hypothetical protein
MRLENDKQKWDEGKLEDENGTNRKKKYQFVTEPLNEMKSLISIIVTGTQSPPCGGLQFEPNKKYGRLCLYSKLTN